jgi:hypothetical protein
VFLFRLVYVYGSSSLPLLLLLLVVVVRGIVACRGGAFIGKG